MIVDLEELGPLQERGHYDVCIAGGGVAGITLATTLAARGRRVLLLEAGGVEYSERSQAIYRGGVVGRDYIDLDVGRLRFLGGSSNHWAGLCRPLDADDFRARPGVESTGWPIDIGAVQPYLEPACELLEIAPTFGERDLARADANLHEVVFRESPPVRFLEKFAAGMRASEALDVHVNANVIGFLFDGGNGRVEAALVRGYRDDGAGAIHHAIADRYVLALGGIENARLLMNAADGSPLATNSGGALVGRYFMDHLHNAIGHYVVNPNKSTLGDGLHFLGLPPEFRQRRQIANCAVRVESMIERRNVEGDALDEVRQLICESTVFRCTDPSEAGTLRAVAEQVPTADSRVVLLDERDNLGLRRVALDWRLSPIDKKTIRAVGLELGRYFALTNIGRVRLADWVLSDDDPVPSVHDGGYGTGFHHMGTTRMGHSRKDGVVDRDCRVFGVPNLYVAGSSVFRTAGHANPTLTIVQLALRLADHLAPV